MKAVKYTSTTARSILIGMITHDAVLSRIAGKWDKEGLFKSEWENTIGQLCVDYYKNYTKAPGKNIKSLFESWSEDGQEREKIKLVDRFLTSLSGQYAALKKEVNPTLLTDMASKHFNKVGMEKFKDKLEGYLERNETDKALLLFDKRNRIELGQSDWIDVLQSQEAFERAFDSKREPLIKLRGPLGRFFSDELERDAFIGVMAPEKRGKSWLLQELGWQAVLQGRRVAMFQVGDLSESQIMRRLGVRIAKQPMKPNVKSGRYEVQVPRKFEVVNGTIDLEREVKQFKRGLTVKAAWDGVQRTIQKIKTHKSLLRLSVHPNSSISASGIGDYLLRWDRDGWSPDVLIIDYADILAPMSGSADTRDQINSTWKYLRRLSQERHCLVITATQANAASYESDKIRRRNFSEDKRKYAHTTGMFAINQIDTEKTLGVMRLNWLVLRENEFSEEECVYVAGCLGLANPMMMSAFNVRTEEEPIEDPEE